MNIKTDQTNFAVGPVQISKDISKIGAEAVPYFRTSEFSALMKENEKLMKYFVHAEENSRCVFLTGSGPAAMEAAVINLFHKKDKLLIVNGGSFGHRFCEICDVYGLNYEAINLAYGETLTRNRLYQYAHKGHTGMLINMHETSTGVLYDMNMVGAFCKENSISLVVDAISSFIADPLDMTEIGADIVLTGSQKALAVPPGVSIVILSERACRKIQESQDVCYYLSLKNALKNGERGQTPFTPAVGILIQLNARLNAIYAHGFIEEQRQIAEIAEYFRRRIKKYPFRMFSSTPSNALTALSPIDQTISAHNIFEILKDEYNIIICPNGGELADKVFRVGHIGSLTIGDNEKLFAAFDSLIERGILQVRNEIQQ